MTLVRIIKMDLIMKMHAFKVGIHGKAMLIMLIGIMWMRMWWKTEGKEKRVDDEVCTIALLDGR